MSLLDRLKRLAGLYPAGVIREIVNDDGTKARVPDLVEFCKKHDLVMITVAEPARYRFDLDYEEALGAFKGIFAVCPRNTAIEIAHLPASAVWFAANAERLP